MARFTRGHSWSEHGAPSQSARTGGTAEGSIADRMTAELAMAALRLPINGATLLAGSFALAVAVSSAPGAFRQNSIAPDSPELPGPQLTE